MDRHSECVDGVFFFSNEREMVDDLLSTGERTGTKSFCLHMHLPGSSCSFLPHDEAGKVRFCVLDVVGLFSQGGGEIENTSQ